MCTWVLAQALPRTTQNNAQVWAVHPGGSGGALVFGAPGCGLQNGGLGGAHQRLRSHLIPPSDPMVVPKIALTLSREGIFTAKGSKNRWVLRENSQGNRAAVGLLRFCLNFTLLGKEMVHITKSDDALQKGSREVLCGCALWDCVPITFSPGAPSLPNEGEKMLLCCPMQCSAGGGLWAAVPRMESPRQGHW